MRMYFNVAALALSLSCATFGQTTRPQGTSEPSDVHAAAPAIPDKTFNLKDFGGVGDGKQLETESFAKALAAVNTAGGGRLIVPAGTHRTLPFVLVSHLDLHLDPGAIIKAPDTFAEYGIADPNVSTTQPTSRTSRERVQPLISCPRGTTDLAVTGSGVIDGSGAMFWIWSDKAARRYPPGRTVLPRPALVALNNVQRLHLDGITLMNSPMFHFVARGCEDVLIENVRVVAPSDAPNTDAIDPAGRRIVIRNCEIDTGDDDVALGSGSRDVLIEDLTCLHGHGISIGSGTRDGLSHVIVRRCTFDGTDNGLRIKSYRGGGGEVHDIQYSDIVMRNVRRPFDINMRYNGNANTNVDVGEREANGKADALPNFHDIHVTNLTVSRSPIAGRIVGIPEQMPSNITFTNVKFEVVRGFFVQDAKEITFENADIKAAVGEPLVTQDAAVLLNGAAVQGAGESAPFYAGN